MVSSCAGISFIFLCCAVAISNCALFEYDMVITRDVLAVDGLERKVPTIYNTFE